jgi:hypothetical protein
VLDPAEGKDLFLIGPEESEQTLPS